MKQGMGREPCCVMCPWPLATLRRASAARERGAVLLGVDAQEHFQNDQ